VEDIRAIDIMNYPFWDIEQWQAREFQILGATLVKTKAGLSSKNVLLETMKKPIGSVPVPTCTPEEFVAQLDEFGYEKVFICALKMWSHWDKKFIWDYTVDEVYEHVKDHQDRLEIAVSYNPFRIEESLAQIDRAVKEYGVKYCYVHPLCFDLRLNDNSLYPCYAKCSELGIPVGMQTGHAAELLPSSGGYPMYLDQIALDFPGLTIIGSHTGWPWVNELVCMAWKHPNVYCDTSAWMPNLLPKLHPALLIFMQFWAGQEKTLFGTNSMGLKAFKEQFLALPLTEEAKRKILRENAIRVLKL